MDDTANFSQNYSSEDSACARDDIFQSASPFLLKKECDLISASSSSSAFSKSNEPAPSTDSDATAAVATFTNVLPNTSSSDASTSTTCDTDAFSLRRIELYRTVGTGTFGRVIAVRDRQNDMFYALKVLIIDDVVRLKQVEHVKNEKNILLQVNHPFLVKLHWTSHDIKFLYMLFDYMCGGELFTYLRNVGRFSPASANFYAAEVAHSFSYLHSKDIAYRDLKPENLLLDIEGHIKITDFGFAKVLKDKTFTMCGTPEYLAPEIIQGKGYNKAVDWWSLGVLIFEMVYGQPPFYDDCAVRVYQKILNMKLVFPCGNTDASLRDIINKLLVIDQTKRLGAMKGGSDDVLRHKWFKHIDWNDVLSRNLKPPFRPSVRHYGDTRCYDQYIEQDWKRVPIASLKSQELFADF